MPTFSYKPDYNTAKTRYDAFWQNAILDRPPVSIILPKPNANLLPDKNYNSWQDRWLDIDFRAEQMSHNMRQFTYYADALPVAWPNLGPEIFSACCGCPYNYTRDTTWTDPIIHDWSTDADNAVLDMNHPLFKTLDRFTDLLLDHAKDNFIVGITDIHPGGDHLTALRDPANLAIDLIENPQHVKSKLQSAQLEYYKFYDYFYNKLTAADMPSTSWLSIVSDEGRFYIPSNDFSIMISARMFEEFFLPGIAEECRFLHRSMYHLDGPGALRHLDMLLDIPELGAVQWVPGAGNEGFAKWIHVYQKIQSAGKGIFLYIELRELELVLQHLRPQGVWFAGINGIPDQLTADRVLARIEKWV